MRKVKPTKLRYSLFFLHRSGGVVEGQKVGRGEGEEERIELISSKESKRQTLFKRE